MRKITLLIAFLILLLACKNTKVASTMSGQEERVIDRNPFESIYDCGKAGSFKNLERELNTMIAGDMVGCRSLISKNPAQ